LLATLFFFALLEGGVFHSGLYARLIEPESTTGQMEFTIENEIRRPKLDPNQILAIGHSRQALMPRIANEMHTGYTFALAGLGGTTPRDWFYTLRAVDPHAHNYAAILIPEDDYNEPDDEDQADRESDLHYLIARLRMKDLLDFPWTYDSAKERWIAFEGIVLKGTVYKTDFQAFLEHPLDRLKKVAFYRKGSAGWAYGYDGDARTLAGLQIDWVDRIMVFPANLPLQDQQRIKGELFKDYPPNRGREAAYRMYWYQRILDHYKNSRTRIFFIRVPRAPTHPPEEPVNPNSAVRRLASNPHVVVLDEHMLDSIESPELFWDGIHLNREGQVRFTHTVANAMCKVLGPPGA
jgi:hypothetical protein